MALDRTDGDEEPGADLRVGQVVADGGQHLRLADGHARLGCCPRGGHPQILPGSQPTERQVALDADRIWSGTGITSAAATAS